MNLGGGDTTTHQSKSVVIELSTISPRSQPYIKYAQRTKQVWLRESVKLEYTRATGTIGEW